MRLDDFEPKGTRARRGIDVNTDMKLRLSNPNYVKATASKNPQVIVKIANNSTTGIGVKNTMDYLARSDEEKPLSLEDQDGKVIEGKEAIKAEYDRWKEGFDKEPEWKLEAHEKYKEWKKENPGKEDSEYEGKIPRMKRQTTHMILSGKVENTDEGAAKLMASVRAVMQREMGDKGHDYLMVLHRDTENPHVHVLINNHNREKDRPKLRINKPELFTLRQGLSQELKDRGVEVEATMRKDRPEMLKDIKKGVERVHQNETWYKAKMEKAAGTMDSFKHRQQQLRAVKRLDREVVKMDNPMSGDRVEIRKELRGLVKAMRTEDKQNLDHKVAKTVQKLSRDSKELGQHLKNLEKPQVKPQGRADKLRRDKILSKYAEGISKDVQAAQKTVKQSTGITSQTRTEALKQLKSIGKELDRMNQGLER